MLTLMSFIIDLLTHWQLGLGLKGMGNDVEYLSMP